MVSGNPPHHSKTSDEPVTIDLEAERAADADAVMKSAGQSNAPSFSDKAEGPDRADSQPLTEEESARATGSGFTAPGGHEHVSDRAEAQPQPLQRQAATSSLVAAGIVGGLIALIGAGAIQYSGLLPSGSASRQETADIAALTAEIDGLKQTVSSLAAAPQPQADQELAARLSALESAAKNPPIQTAAAAAPTDEAANRQVADLSAQVEQLKASIANANQQQANTGADISKRLDDAEKKLSEPRQDAAVARAVAAAALKAAIDRGGPFRPELDTFASITPDDPAIADLKTFAESGIPSRADLIRRAPDVATAILAAVQQPETDASWSDRLMASAKSLVKVRPVGNVEGSGVDAITARFEDKVRNGDLPGAITEWNTLPDAAKSASAAFKQSLDARIRVEDMVGDALSKAIANTGRQS